MSDIEKKIKKGQALRKLMEKKYPTSVITSIQDYRDKKIPPEEWIPTGSRLLDGIINHGTRGGIPVGKITQLAGLSQTGKSFLSLQIAKNATDMGIFVVYFDTEARIKESFIEKIGVNPDLFLLIKEGTLENILSTMQDWLSGYEDKILFVIDSMANVNCKAEREASLGGMNAAGMHLKIRILNEALKNLMHTLYQKKCTLLFTNQLYTNLAAASIKWPTEEDMFLTKGGKGLYYSTSLSIWMKPVRFKSSYVYVSKDDLIKGSTVRCWIQKSDFGTLKRSCEFQILWGDEVKILDEESLLEVAKTCPEMERSGPWYALTYEDGTTQKFQTSNYVNLMKTDAKFKKRIEEIVDNKLINNFTPSAENHGEFVLSEEEFLREEEKND